MRLLNVLTTSEQIHSFLRQHDIPETDEDIVWTCPECNEKNVGAYFSHDRPCVCRRFKFPRMYINEKDSIMEEIKRYEEEIRENDCRIDMLEGENDHLRDQLRQCRALFSMKEVKNGN